jgi:hypothetical protein
VNVEGYESEVGVSGVLVAIYSYVSVTLTSM